MKNQLQKIYNLFQMMEWDMKNIAERNYLTKLPIAERNAQIDYLQGELYGIARYTHKLFMILAEENSAELFEQLYLIPTHRQKHKMVITDMVSNSEDIDKGLTEQINNDSTNKITVYKEYPHHILHLLDVYDNWRDFGIYDDDAGQQDYIKFDDEHVIGFGAYNDNFRWDAIYEYIHYICNIYHKQLESYRK